MTPPTTPPPRGDILVLLDKEGTMQAVEHIRAGEPYSIEPSHPPNPYPLILVVTRRGGFREIPWIIDAGDTVLRTRLAGRAEVLHGPAPSPRADPSTEPAPAPSPPRRRGPRPREPGRVLLHRALRDLPETAVKRATDAAAAEALARIALAARAYDDALQVGAHPEASDDAEELLQHGDLYRELLAFYLSPRADPLLRDALRLARREPPQEATP